MNINYTRYHIVVGTKSPPKTLSWCSLFSTASWSRRLGVVLLCYNKRNKWSKPGLWIFHGDTDQLRELLIILMHALQYGQPPKFPLPVGVLNLISCMVPCTHKLTPRRHLDLFRRFCTVCVWPTHWERWTHRPCCVSERDGHLDHAVCVTSAAVSHIYAMHAL